MTKQDLSPETRVQSLIEITQSLTTIFEQENTLLASQRPREIAPLQAEKARLAAAYAQSIRDIATNRGLVDNADEMLLATLKEITQSFEERAREQETLIDSAKRASEGVVKAVAKEASALNGRPQYGETPSNTTHQAPPISLDESA